jgi:hypothetical protein
MVATVTGCSDLKATAVILPTSAIGDATALLDALAPIEVTPLIRRRVV